MVSVVSKRVGFVFSAWLSDVHGPCDVLEIDILQRDLLLVKNGSDE